MLSTHRALIRVKESQKTDVDYYMQLSRLFGQFLPTLDPHSLKVKYKYKNGSNKQGVEGEHQQVYS